MAHARSFRILTLALLAVLGATPLFAAHGHITGRITRSDGSGIGGVIVQVVELSKVQLTDQTGSYVFEVPPGTYSLSFVAGDQAVEQTNVVVASGGTTRIDKKVDWQLSVAQTITVYSASRRTERVTEAPAAITVLKDEDIEAVAPSGQAPRMVETAPGVDFTQSGLYDSNFNARGFNSSLNRRILTLIDGRDPAVAFLGSQEWAAISFPLDELASVELIRGPGSALYGANAYSGVLNMTTKLPRDDQGGRVTVSGGDLSTRRGDLRFSRALGNDWFFRVVGGYQESDDFARPRNASAEYTTLCSRSGESDCLPREARGLVLDNVNVEFAGLRLDHHFQNTNLFTLEGGYAKIKGPLFQTGIGRVQVTDVKRPWVRTNFNMPRWNFSAYYDGRKAENQVALSSGAGLYEDSHNLHGEVMTNWDFNAGRGRLVGGVAWNDQHVDTAGPNGVQTLMLEAKSEQQQSAFGQIEYDVTKNVKLVGAARYDDSTLHDPQFSPKAAIVYSTNTGHTFRYGYNRAFQRPNYSELFLFAPAAAPVDLAAAAAANPQTAPLAPALQQLGFGPLHILAVGNDALDVEKVRSHEVGYAGIFNGKLYLTVDLYKSKLTDFVTDLLPGINPAYTQYVVPGTLPAPVQAGVTQFLQIALGPRYTALTTVNGQPAIVFSYANAGKVDTQGGEIAFNYYVTDNWIVDFNYSRFELDVKSQALGDQLLPNAPENKFNLGLAWHGTKADAKISYRWVDKFRWAAGVFVGDVPQYDVVNLAGRYHITDRVALGADVSNILDDNHYEAFGGDLLGRRALAFVSFDW